jgi:hypothetical protein
VTVAQRFKDFSANSGMAFDEFSAAKPLHKMDALSFVVSLRHSLAIFGVECDGRVEHMTINYSLMTTTI